MRILFATSIRTWGGGEEWMLGAAEGLRGRGHDTALIAPGDAVILARARDAGLETVATPFNADLDAVSFARTWRWCRERRPDVLLLNMDRVLRVAGTAARLAGVPVVVPRRGSEFPLKDGPLYRFTYRRLATAMIVNSRATADTLVRRIEWRPAGRVHVLPNGVDLERIAAARSRDAVRRELGVADGAQVLLVVGELTTRKNASLLVERVPALAERFPGLVVLLAGEGRERDTLAAQAAALGVSSAVRLLGFRRDVPDLLAAADVLVHPARVEGFGYAVAEAMAAGLPVVATRASSLPELVEDGRTGTLFAPDDGDALERAVARYLEDADLRAAHGAAGRQRAAREYSRERRLAELETILAAELESARTSG